MTGNSRAGSSQLAAKALNEHGNCWSEEALVKSAFFVLLDLFTIFHFLINSWGSPGIYSLYDGKEVTLDDKASSNLRL